MGKEFDKRKTARNNEDREIRPDESREASLPNSLVMRVMQQPDAEDEADRLSGGVTSSSPAMLRREMGERLGADFSQVHFHCDTNSIQRSAALGARAWTQGRDVYFGKGGFEPSVAAHELVHTVQQGAVRGNAGTSMPFGAVQLLPDEDEDDKKIKKGDAQEAAQQDQGNDQGKAEPPAMTAIENSLVNTFTSENGSRVYRGFSGKLKSLINKKAGKRNISFTPANGIRFMARAAYRDYAMRELLIETAAKPVDTKGDVRQRIHDYKALIDILGSRMGEDQAEALAISTGMFTGIPKYEHPGNKEQSSRRAYEAEGGENGLVDFNPNNVPELGKVQAAIDDAKTPEQAYRIFAAFTGNRGGRFTDKFRNYKLDMNIFRSKLKHMARVVTDYPELRNQIGDMVTEDPNTTALMSTEPTLGGTRQANFSINAKYDREGAEGDAERAQLDAENEISKNHISPREYHGTHEMGHVMGSLLVSGDGIRKGNIDSTRFVEQFKNKKAGLALDPKKADQGFSSMRNKFEEAVYNLPENDMIMDTIAKHGKALNKEYGKIGMSEHSSTGINKFGHAHLKNQLDTNSSQFFTKGMTSGYGSESAGEFFAEAVADVYSHGKNAKTMSKLLVQEYEGRQKNLVRSQFNKKKKRNWWHKLWGI